MSNWDSYKHEERPRLAAGDIRLMVVSAEEGISKSSGNPMIIVGVRPNGTNMTIKHYISKNQYFNQNMTEFFECFDIPEGDFNFPTWVNALGAGKLKEDENGYMKVARFLSPEKAAELPGWIGEAPERQTISELPDDDGELPF